MSTPSQSTDSDSPTSKRLSLLYDEQRSLLERLTIHQRNLQELHRQKAMHGIQPPLNIINGIHHEEQSITDVEKNLVSVEQQISKIVDNQLQSLSQVDKPVTSLNMDGIDYLIEVPFPTLGNQTTMSPNGEILSTFRYAAGFETRVISKPNTPMKVSFFRHNRQVVPQIDETNKKIVVPLGRAIQVNRVELSTRYVEKIQDIPANRISEGIWTVIAPSQPLETINYCDWPQGFKDYIMTTKIVYSNGHELWIVKSPDTPLNTLWFYLDNWHVAPDMDQEHLCLTFPC